MLKPEPMRDSRAVATHISGPEWTEPELAENGIPESPDALAFHHEDELPADLALDLRLHEILEHAVRATAATGAVIALSSGDKMVCRATSGKKAPSTGAFLNTRSGLSGLCVQTGEMQRCDDTRTDPRVNADACRNLDIQSIVVLPVLEGTKLWGILEIFSSLPHAFSDADIQALQALGRRVSHTVREAVEGGSLRAEPEMWSVGPQADPGQSETMAREIVAREIMAREVLGSGLRERSNRRRDYRTGALTAAVIALAVLLGWMVGRVGWSMAVNRAQAQIPVSPEEAQAAAPVPPQTAPAAAVVEPVASAKPVNPAPGPPTASKPAPKPKAEAAEPAGGLVVYEQGKVVFRMAPLPKSLPSGSDSAPVQTAVEREGDPAAGSTPIAPPAAYSYLLERVEPEYPEEARQEHIQGPVVLNALVGTDGAVRELKVMSGDPHLVRAATDAVRQWRFRPHRLQGRFVEFETRITVNFALP